MLLYDRLIELYKRDDPLLSKIFLMLNGIKTDFEIVSKTPNINLNFMTQDGGAKMTIPIDKIRYSYNVEYARPIDAKYSDNEVRLLTVNEGIDGCGLILINNETHEANIQSVSDYEDCIICENPPVEYKVGAVLMQIIIHECKKLKIRKITLEDNSIKKFTGCSIELIYYRTMSQGTPYYSKFGFKSSSLLKVRSNEKNWKEKPQITKNKLIELLKKNTTKRETNLVELFKKILEKYKDNIIVSDILIKLFDKAVRLEKEITIKRDNGENINYVNLYAKIIYLILKDLYVLTGYELLPDNKFTLFIRSTNST